MAGKPVVLTRAIHIVAGKGVLRVLLHHNILVVVCFEHFQRVAGEMRRSVPVLRGLSVLLEMDAFRNTPEAESNTNAKVGYTVAPFEVQSSEAADLRLTTW